VLIERYALRDGSGGAGRFRGGTGSVHEYLLLVDHNLSGLGDRHRVAPWGIEGGADGTPNRWSLRRDGVTRELVEVLAEESVELLQHSAARRRRADHRDRGRRRLRCA
jgi:N-methylhydantoinase B